MLKQVQSLLWVSLIFGSLVYVSRYIGVQSSDLKHLAFFPIAFSAMLGIKYRVAGCLGLCIGNFLSGAAYGIDVFSEVLFAYFGQFFVGFIPYLISITKTFKSTSEAMRILYVMMASFIGNAISSIFVALFFFIGLGKPYWSSLNSLVLSDVFFVIIIGPLVYDIFCEQIPKLKAYKAKLDHYRSGEYYVE